MIYNEFNKYIYEYFFKKENFGETVIMIVDSYVMNNFYEKYNTTEQELKNDFKRIFLTPHYSFTQNKKIPRNIGFVALQIFVAYLMHSDDNYTERAYRPRLADFLQIDEKYDLKRLFELYQDTAWQMLQNWGEENGYILHIPKLEELQWNRRYVSYPLSQALLNQEDLMKMRFIFEKAGLKPDEYLAFEDFVKLIKLSDRNIHLPKHYYRIKEKLQKQNKEQLLQLQLFGFFNNEWDGSYPNEIKEDKGKNKQVEKHRTVLTICDELKIIKILNREDYQTLNEYTLENPQLFKAIKKHYKPFYKDILIFIQDYEWNDCRYLELNSEHIIICKKNSRAEVLIRSLDSNPTKIPNQFFSVFKVSLTNKISNHYYWFPFFSKRPKNYAFKKGLKLSRKTWMLGAGPTIEFLSETDAWINGEKITFQNNELEISCRDFEEGTYKLIVKGLPPEKFQIMKPKVNPNIETHGWQVNNSEPFWEHNPNYFQFSGLTTYYSCHSEKANTRTWVNALTQKSNKNKNSSIVINAIKQSKYGI